MVLFIRKQQMNTLTEHKREPIPYDSASVFSRLFFCWLFPLLNKGRSKFLKEDDLYEHSEYNSSEYLGNLLQKEWDIERKKKNPSIIKALLRFSGKKILFLSLLTIFQETVLITMQPYLLGIIVSYFDHKSESNKLTAYLSIAGFFGLCAIFSFTYHIGNFVSEVLGMKLKIAFCTLIYRKALNLSPASLVDFNKGQMVNLLANDVSKFYISLYTLLYVVTSPLLIIIVVIMLWKFYGWIILVGTSVLFIYFPIQILCGKIYSKLRLKAAILADERINLLNQMIAGMRLIKMYTWELPYLSLIENIRKRELKTVRKFIYVRGIISALVYPISRLFCCITFTSFFFNGNKLHTEMMFVTMNFSIYISFSIVTLFSVAVKFLSELHVSLKRLQTFLLLEEKDKISLDISKEGIKSEKHGITMKNIKAGWNNDDEPILNGISFNAQPGELLIVIGTVGSGKTSLLMSILGEIPISSGEVITTGKIAYACQEAWIFNGTIRENILFGEEYNDAKYKKVLHITTLEQDIKVFPNKDLTHVGERGVIMSGGQKARINLARALYLDADIFILDDPLSAVDTPVAKHIFEKCIVEYLKDKICVLVTHQIQFLSCATKVLLLKEGKCDVIANCCEIENFKKNNGIILEDKNSEKNTQLVVVSFNDDEMNKANQDNISNYIDETFNNAGTENNKTTKEDGHSGIEGLSVYKAYINSGAGFIFKIFILLMLCLSQLIFNASDVWLIKWLKDERKYNHIPKFENFSSEMNFLNSSYVEDIHESRLFNIYVYCGLICGLLLMSCFSASLVFEMFVRASKNLHNNMIRCVIHTPISFVDNNPVGKLLNRFSKDINSVDDLLTLVAFDSIKGILQFIGIFVIEVIFCPYAIITGFVMSIIMYFLWNIHNRALKSIKYLEGKSRSPVFSHLSVSLYGLTTIRSFKTEKNFINTFHKYQDKHTALWFLYLSINRWLGIYSHIICIINFIVVFVLTALFITDEAGSKIGLVMNYGLLMFLFLQWVIRQSSEMEYQMNSVARILNYSTLKSEAAYDSSPETQPPPHWPQKGKIDFNNVSLQYSNDKLPVLHNITFNIYSGENIGIVGRTGAGKSSIVAALFRMIETTGSITIDGVVVNNIGLRDLRSKISIIPQDPMLFTGPLRRNIDPFNEYSEEIIWKALEEVQMKGFIGRLPGGLDTHLMEGGSNFSVGQRQLICLARAILRQNKILVMDEATSNIDKLTDSCIQKIIREKFNSCTVLTIAHRLHTIIDSDRILVIDKGRIEEFDNPYKLLMDANSKFSNLVKNTGKIAAEELYKIAERKYNDEQNVIKTKM